jgi:anti-anti-sigma factor
MQISESRAHGVLIAAPVGRIDSTTSAALENCLLRYVSDGERKLVIDLGQVDYLTSAGLRVLLALAKRMRGTSERWCSARWKNRCGRYSSWPGSFHSSPWNPPGTPPLRGLPAEAVGATADRTT